MSFKRFFSTLWTYITTTLFWKTILKLVIFIIVVILLTSLYLRIYTRHGQEYLTPELRGYTLPQAQKLIKRKNFKIKVIDSIDNTVENPLLPGTIVDQSPPSNFNIKEGRTIFVTIIAYRVKMVQLPELPGYVSITQAENELRPLGLRLGKIVYLPSPKDDGLVYAMMYQGDTVQPGYRVPKGSKIDLIVLKVTRDSILRQDSVSAQEQKKDEIWNEF